MPTAQLPGSTRPRFLGAAFALAAAASSVIASVERPEEPSGRNKPVFAFDTTRRAVVLFGGFRAAGGTVLDDGWAWSDRGWERLESTAFPARAGAGVATDARRGRVVLFGGEDGEGPRGDTWEWDGKRWTRVAETGPLPRTVPQLAYDSRRGRTVLFGGWDAKQQTLGDTWEWDGVGWTKVSEAGPPPRFQHVMVYDAARARVVLFGGNSASGKYSAEVWRKGILGDTWEWDGAQWSRNSVSGPSPRDHHAMAYDAARSKVVLFGGWDGKFLADLWEWNGMWRRVDLPGPSARGGLPSMAYDLERKTVVLYGGWGDGGALTDSWRWDGRSWQRL
jgi:hypothetical protein